MAYSFVQGATGSNNAATTSLGVAFSASVAAGDLLICAVTSYNSTAAGTDIKSVSDSLNGTWTKIASIKLGTGNTWLDLWYFPNAAAGATTPTVNLASGDTYQCYVAIGEYAGIATATPLDQSLSANGSGTAYSVGPTAAISAANELVLGAFGNLGYAFTAGTGFTFEEQLVLRNGTDNGGVGFEDMAASSTAGQTATASAATSGNWGTVVAVFKLASGTTVQTGGATEAELSATSAPSLLEATGAATQAVVSGGGSPTLLSATGGLAPGALTASGSPSLVSATGGTAQSVSQASASLSALELTGGPGYPASQATASPSALKSTGGSAQAPSSATCALSASSPGSTGGTAFAVSRATCGLSLVVETAGGAVALAQASVGLGLLLSAGGASASVSPTTASLALLAVTGGVSQSSGRTSAQPSLSVAIAGAALAVLRVQAGVTGFTPTVALLALVRSGLGSGHIRTGDVTDTTRTGKSTVHAR